MATDEAIAAGLIDWINSLSVTAPVYTVDDFTNGDLIWKVLRACDGDVPQVLAGLTGSQSKSIDSAFLANYLRIRRRINGFRNGPT